MVMTNEWVLIRDGTYGRPQGQISGNGDCKVFWKILKAQTKKNESADSSRCADVIGIRSNGQTGVCCPIPW